MTQEELGKKINVTKVSISGYENGNRTPDMETLQKIAEVFDVSIDYLLGRADDPAPPLKYSEASAVRQYDVFLRELKTKYPDVNIDDPDIRRKLMKAIDLVLDDYQRRQ